MSSKGSVARAYVQVVPTADGMKAALSDLFGSEMPSAGKSAGGIFGSSFASTIKNVLVTAGVGKMIGDSLNAGADLQQSLGGIETLFKDSADIVIANAQQAYKTAGMSANSYMEMVTGFSASLLQGLAGDTEAAANVADMALKDMSDNANKMGTSMDLIQNAYQGFAKQNYTMLDNLKLGYGGTKTEMERLLADAQKLTGVEYDISNLADVYEAIHVIQKEMGIMDATTLEASTTFSGSLTAMKAAASDLLANLSLGEDITGNLEALGETVSTFLLGNLFPMVGNILTALPTVVGEALSMGIQGLNIAANNADALVAQGVDIVLGIGSAIITALPYLAEAAVNLVTSFGTAIIETDWTQMATDTISMIQESMSLASAEILGTDTSLLNAVSSSITENLPGILEDGVSIVTEVATGMLSNLPEAVGAAGDLMNGILSFLMSSVPDVLRAGSGLALGLVDGIIDCLPDVASSAVEVCGELLSTIGSELPEFLSSGIEIICELAAGLIEAVPDVLVAVGEVLADIGEAIISFDWMDFGGDIISGIASGISNGASAIIKAAKNAAKSALQAAKDFLGIKSPSRVFKKEVGEQIPAGVAIGVDEGKPVVKAAMAELSAAAEDSFQLGDMSFGMDALEFTRNIDVQNVQNTDVERLAEILTALMSNAAMNNQRVIDLLMKLLEAVLGIEIGGEAVARLVSDYRRKIAVVKGG